jgi:D-alanyl-D-alanine carboxypeptidase
MKKINPIHLALLVLTIFAFVSLNAQTGTTPTNLGTLENRLQAQLDSITSRNWVPGATLSVRFANNTNLSLASGLADAEELVPMKPDAVMFSGSVGKTYVAAVALKLVEKGLIDLKTKAGSYLKDEAWFARVPNSGQITVEMLMNHTAGIPEYVYKKELWIAIHDNPDREWTVEQRLAFIFGDPPVNEAGKGWSYADSHYLVVGLIIEKVTGKPYYEVLDELILKPFNLQNTHPSDKRTLPGLIAGYTSLTEDFLLPRKVLADSRYVFNPQMEWTGGGLISTVSDLTLWARKLYGGEVLTRESMEKMFTPAPFPTILPEKAGYGLACFIGKTNGVPYYGHSGFVPGYLTFVQYLPDSGIAIALQVNSDSPHRSLSTTALFNSIKNDVLKYAGTGK